MPIARFVTGAWLTSQVAFFLPVRFAQIALELISVRPTYKGTVPFGLLMCHLWSGHNVMLITF